jgi:hypothetical protein
MCLLAGNKYPRLLKTWYFADLKFEVPVSVVHNILSSILPHWKRWYSGNVLGSYLQGARFESRAGSRLFQVSFLVVFLIPSRNSGIVPCLGHIRLLPNSNQIIYHLSSRRYVVCLVTESLINPQS